jgi:TBC1 domain family member 13
VPTEGHHNVSAEHVDNGFLHRSEVTREEHPLSLGKTSAWNQFFEVHRRLVMIYNSLLSCL